MPLALHAPDGFLDPATSLATAVIALTLVALAARHARRGLADKLVPLAGVTAAFVFAGQMLNFPIAAGTTGHLVGATLAAVLLGPHVAVVVMTVVVVVQALAFADGGLTALGYNLINMAIVPAYGGYAVFRLGRRLLPSTGSGVVAAVGLAAWASIVMSAMAFSIEWLFGATAPVAFDDVFVAMVGTHALIGIGEAFISAVTVGAVMAARPDLVFGASDLDRAELADRQSVKTRAVLVSGSVVAVVLAAVVSQFAATAPDGLEAVAEEQGFATTEADRPLTSALFADYATDGIDNESWSLAVAGISGTVITLGVAAGLLGSRRRRPGDRVGTV